MKPILLAALLAAPAFAADRYVLDASHSQVLFSYDHLGFSTTFGMFSGFEGELMLDAESPENSSVRVEIPVAEIITGWTQRDQHFLSDDFFAANENPTAVFESTSVEVTGEQTALVTGDLTVNGVTQEIVLDTRLTQMGEHPRAQKPWAGFHATTTILRSDFEMGRFAPFVGDEVELVISIEAELAE